MGNALKFIQNDRVIPIALNYIPPSLHATSKLGAGGVLNAVVIRWGRTMGETVGSGEITSKNRTTKVINTYMITLYNKPGVSPATLVQVEQVLLDLQQSADAHNLRVDVEKITTSLL